MPLLSGAKKRATSKNLTVRHARRRKGSREFAARAARAVQNLADRIVLAKIARGKFEGDRARRHAPAAVRRAQRGPLAESRVLQFCQGKNRGSRADRARFLRGKFHEGMRRQGFSRGISQALRGGRWRGGPAHVHGRAHALLLPGALRKGGQRKIGEVPFFHLCGARGRHAEDARGFSQGRIFFQRQVLRLHADLRAPARALLCPENFQGRRRRTQGARRQSRGLHPA